MKYCYDKNPVYYVLNSNVFDKKLNSGSVTFSNSNLQQIQEEKVKTKHEAKLCKNTEQALNFTDGKVLHYIRAGLV